MPREPREHDLAYRDLFTHPELVEDLLRHFVSEPWVEEVDFSTLQRESEVSVVRRRGLRLRDVVWSVRFRGRALYILILIEFQSRLDPVMALRQLVYVASFYEDLCRQKRLTENGKLPPVLPVVLYNGEHPWRLPCSVEEMIEAAPEPLARYQPRMSYFLLDEQRTRFHIEEEERNTVAGLLALEQSQRGPEVIEVVSYLVNLLREPRHESLRQAFKQMVLKVLDPVMAPIAEVFDHPEDLMTNKQRLKAWYDEEKAASRAEGHQEGRTEGRQEGHQEGQCDLLANLLRFKFGPLDVAIESRLAAATPAELNRWAERMLSASSLSEVLN